MPMPKNKEEAKIYWDLMQELKDDPKAIEEIQFYLQSPEGWTWQEFQELRMYQKRHNLPIW